MVFQAANDQGNYFIRNYTPEEYGTHPQNWWGIAQNSRGVMYFANFKGVLEFDGVYWRLHSIPNTPSVLSLGVDNDDVVYVGGVEEFGYMDADNQGKLNYVSLKSKLSGSDIDFINIWRVLITNQAVFFLSENQIFQWQNQTLQAIPANLFRGFGSVCDNLLFVYEVNKGICVVQDGRLMPLPQCGEMSMANVGLVYIIPFQSGKLLILTNKGFFSYDLNLLYHNELKKYNFTEKVEPDIIKPFPIEVSDYINANNLNGALKINDHCFALLTFSGGLILINDQGKYVNVINKNRGLLDDTVYHAWLDKNKNLWVAMNYGLSYIETGSPITYFDENHGFSGLGVCLTHYNNRLYFGTFTGLYYLEDYSQQPLGKKPNFQLIKKSGRQYFDFYVFKNKLYGAMSAGVTEIIDTKILRLIPCGVSCSFGFSNKFPDYLFVGGLFGLYTFQPTKPDTTINQSPSEPNNHDFPELKQHVILKIATDPEGDLWLTSQNRGIVYLKFSDHDLTKYQITFFTTKAGLPNIELNFLTIIQGRFLVATHKSGIYRGIVPASGNLADMYFEPDPLFSSSPIATSKVIDIKTDKKNRYWVLCNEHLISAVMRPGGSMQFSLQPYKQISSSLTFPYIDKHNVIWLPTTSKRVFRFDQAKEKDYQTLFYTLIRKVSTTNANVLYFGCYTAENLPKNKTPVTFLTSQPQHMIPKLPYKSNSLTFEYAASFYESSSNNQFRYQLEGFNQIWSDWSSETKSSYTNLPEGNYTFKVKSKNIFEHEGVSAGYGFSISPPWQRTLWAYISYILLFFASIYGGIHLYGKRLIIAKRNLELIVAKRTSEVVRQRDEISKQKNEITSQRDEIKTYANELYSSNLQLLETKNALWGEMELAKKIQTVLLPKDPHIPGYDIAACMQPADEVGGDYYDVIEIREEPRLVPDGITPRWGEKVRGEKVDAERGEEEDGATCRGGACLHPDSERDEEKNGKPCRGGSCAGPQASGQPQRANLQHPNMGNLQDPTTTAPETSHWLTIGDVSGHGVPAGLVMMMVQTCIRSVIRENPTATPAQILHSVNITIHENIQKLGEDKYMTITLMAVQPDGTIYYSGLHQDIIIYRADKKDIEVIETKGMWIGMLPDLQGMLKVDQITLHSGDTMLLYTDGLTEAKDKNNAMFSEEKLAQIFKHLAAKPPAQIKEDILQHLEPYSCDDDITLLIIKKL
jgi:serine phosphatase RsbU (regulator of sigma subunit)